MLKKSISIIGIVVFIFILLITVYAIELYSDDFYYISFFNNGISSFITENIWHYKNINGRALVHIIDEIILYLGKYSYMIFLPVILLATFYLSSKIFKTKDNFLYSISISSLLFLFIDKYVLKETAFWITGALNYIFPVFTALCATSIIQKIIKENKFHIYQLILLFLTSATTEQGFIMTFLLSLGIIILDNIKNKKIINKITIAPLIIELLGFLSIFLSPASRLRAESTKTIFNYPIVKLFEENFGEFSLTIVGENSIAILISILLISLAILTIQDKKINKTLLLGLPIGITILVLHILNLCTEKIAIITVAILMVYIALSIIFLFKYEKYQTLALFLLVAFCVQGATFGLGEISYRTLLPLTLLIILSTSYIISNLNIKLEIPIFFILLFTGIYLITPTCIGYYENKKIIDSMKTSIQNYSITGEININTNINKDYAHIMGYENADFLNYFLKYYNIKDYEEDVYFNLNGDESILYVNGNRIRYSAYIDEKDIYVPVRFIIEELGGICNWTPEKTTYAIDNYYIDIDNTTFTVIDSSNKSYIGTNLSNSIRDIISRTYANINDICYFIGNTNCKIKIGNNVYNFSS